LRGFSLGLEIAVIYILKMNANKILSTTKGFQWDEHNISKNWNKHKISNWECEEAFFNEPLVIRFDSEHSQFEERYYALGHSDSGQKLFIVFTIRNKLIRPVTFRNMTTGESRIYDEYKKK
jgi:uncharacterized DUF497 family protein